MMRRVIGTTLPWAGLLLASGVLHVAALRSLPPLARVMPGANHPLTSIDFELARPASPPSPAAVAARVEDVPAAPKPARQGPEPRERRVQDHAPIAREPVPTAEPTVGDVAPPAEPAQTAPAQPAGPTVERETTGVVAQPSLNLDPRRVALSTLIDPNPAAANQTPADLATTRGEALSRELKALANDNPRRARRTPKLEHHDDGTCSYRGDAISATILADGGVRFEDKAPEVELAAIQPTATGRPVMPEDREASRRIVIGVKVAERAWDAERAWFLRETAGLRAELADAAHARELAGAEHDLRKQLDQIWCKVTVPAMDRRREIFTLWDGTSGDEVGARGRRTIEQYLRENLPHGGPFAYPQAQLAELNLQRTQAERFDPYGTGAIRDAGAADSAVH